MENKLVLASTQLLLGKISSFMENKISLLRGVDDEFKEIKLELISMQGFLQDAHIRGTNDIARQKAWVSSVRDLVYEVEDIIEECTYHLHNRHKKGGRFTRSFFQIISFPENVWWRHQIGKKLKKINRKIKAIPERSQRYSLGQLAGGLLSTKKSRAEWIEVLNRLYWEIANNPMLVLLKSILLLSFNDLPYSIKQCFLYLSLFPEDCKFKSKWIVHLKFKSKWIVHLWVAEGFVEHIKGSIPEEVGESYLRELIARNMLLIEEKLYGINYVFRMHDLIGEVALSITESDKFGVIADDKSRAMRLIEHGAYQLNLEMK